MSEDYVQFGCQNAKFAALSAQIFCDNVNDDLWQGSGFYASRFLHFRFR